MLVLDGAHTVEAVRGLVGSLQEAMPQRARVVVFAVAVDKQYRELLRELAVLQPRMVVFTYAAVKGVKQQSRRPGKRLLSTVRA